MGRGICKKRIAIPGQGKSGSTRTLVAKRHKGAVFFLEGRQKSSPGADFSAVEEEAAKMFGPSLQNAHDVQLNQLVAQGTLMEICNEENDE